MISAKLLHDSMMATAIEGIQIDLPYQGREEYQGQRARLTMLELGVDPEAFAEFSARNIRSFYETVAMTEDVADSLAMVSMFSFMVGLRCGRDEPHLDPPERGAG